ncbi:BamA/TamA family outer membrane protein [Pseudodesulfovibrio sp.]|uniref:BamA/TamA family outer membrane protein n=1 Tax=Pseudodesulfovibrio sp. TaxID=2035812 RepID=UPI002601F2A8|nr:BamA/TamA family outer membrane protein [Pseudodesulfovibrio sp.]MDD3311378.1 BamA/TamA family outer membrane protein [Pseudodesulfovibrio sp.]
MILVGHMRIPSLLCVFLAVCVASISPCLADGDAGWFDAMHRSGKAAERKAQPISDRIVVAPVPMVNPTLGAGLIGVGMYMHPKDSFWNDEASEDNATRQSISGIAALASTNGSWGVGAFHKGFYDNDTFRGVAFLAYGDFQLKYFGSGDDAYLRDNPVGYAAKITAFQPELMARVEGDWFVGAKYSLFSWDFGADLSKLSPTLPYLNHTITTAGLGLVGERDTTDDSVYPTRGGLFQFEATDYGGAWGGDFEYAKASASYAHYFPLTDKLVLAGQGELNLSTGSTPFFDMPFLHLRGFPYAKYIDKQSSSIQGEARYKLSEKWAANIFAGLGWTSGEPGGLYKGPTIPTGGFGIRYLIAEEQKMYLGMDLAFGPGSTALYFRLGEWF